jgi:hypothetical protein
MFSSISRAHVPIHVLLDWAVDLDLRKDRLFNFGIFSSVGQEVTRIYRLLGMTRAFPVARHRPRYKEQ